MAFAIITGITVAGEPQILSNDPAKVAIEVCMRAWNCADDEQAEDEKLSHWIARKTPGAKQ